MTGLVEQTKLQVQIQPVAPAQASKVDERPIPHPHSDCAEGLNLEKVYLWSLRRTTTPQSSVYSKLMRFPWQFLLHYLSIHFDRDEPVLRIVINFTCFSYHII